MTPDRIAVQYAAAVATDSNVVGRKKVFQY